LIRKPDIPVADRGGLRPRLTFTAAAIFSHAADRFLRLWRNMV